MINIYCTRALDDIEREINSIFKKIYENPTIFENVPNLEILQEQISILFAQLSYQIREVMDKNYELLETMDSFKNAFFTVDLDNKLNVEDMNWIDEFTSNDYIIHNGDYTDSFISFENKDDMMLFKLKFGKNS